MGLSSEFVVHSLPPHTYREQAEGQEGEGEEPAQEEEEEPKEMTLDEYKAKQNLVSCVFLGSG